MADTLGYIGFFNGKTVEITDATSLYGAKVKAIAYFKPRKSQEHMVTVQLAERNGEPVSHIAVD